MVIAQLKRVIFSLKLESARILAAIDGFRPTLQRYLCSFLWRSIILAARGLSYRAYKPSVFSLLFRDEDIF